MVVVSIEDLDLFLALRKEDPLLEKELKEVVEVEPRQGPETLHGKEVGGLQASRVTRVRL